MARRFIIASVVLLVSGSVSASAAFLINSGDTWTYANANPSTAAGDVTGFQAPGYDDSGWYTGAAPFSDSGGGDFGANTYWSPDWDPSLRKTVYLASPVDAVVELGVDNGFDFWVNGTFIGGANAEGGTYQWEYTFGVPAAAFVPGFNVIAIQLEDHGGSTAFDMRMTPEPASLLALSVALLLRRR